MGLTAGASQTADGVDENQNQIKKSTNVFQEWYNSQKTLGERLVNFFFQAFLLVFLGIPFAAYWIHQNKTFKENGKVHHFTLGGKKDKEAESKDAVVSNNGEGDAKKPSGNAMGNNESSVDILEEQGKETDKKDSEKAASKTESKKGSATEHHKDPEFSLSASKKEAHSKESQEKARNNPTALDYELAAAVKAAGENTAEIKVSVLPPILCDLKDIIEKNLPKKDYKNLLIKRASTLKEAMTEKGLLSEEWLKNKQNSKFDNGEYTLKNLPEKAIKYFQDLAGKDNPTPYNNAEELYNLLLLDAAETKALKNVDTLSIQLRTEQLANTSYYWFVDNFLNNFSGKGRTNLENTLNDKLSSPLLKEINAIVTGEVKVDKSDGIQFILNLDQTKELLEAKKLVQAATFDSGN